MVKYVIVASVLLFGANIGIAVAQDCSGANQCQCQTGAGTKFCGVKSGSGCACEVR